MKRLIPPLLALIASASTPSLNAFPPAPYYTLFGIVRDQVGQTLDVEGATLILLKGGVEIDRTPINSALQIDQNAPKEFYRLSVR